MMIKNEILRRINTKVMAKKDTGGHRDFADLCCDILHQSNRTNHDLAMFLDLSESTVKRIKENIKPYNPNSRTIEKIMKAYDFQMDLQ